MVRIGVGFALMGLGITLLATAQTKIFVSAFVALLAFGMAFIESFDTRFKAWP